MRKINIAPGLVLSSCVLIYLGYYKALGAFLLASCAHEAAHILLLILFGVPVKSLFAGEGQAVIRTGTQTPLQNLLTSFAGPAVNIVLAILLRRTHPLFSFISGFLAVYNLLPIFPLDGGRMLLTALNSLLQPARAVKISRVCSFAFSILLMLLAAWAAAVLQNGVWLPLCAGVALLRLDAAGEKELQFFP